MLLQIKCCLWDILERSTHSCTLLFTVVNYNMYVFIVCHCKGLCICRMNTKRGFSEHQQYVGTSGPLFAESFSCCLIIRVLIISKLCHTTSQLWEMMSKEGTVCSFASQSCLTGATHENGQFGLAKTWLAFTVAVTGCLTVWSCETGTW